MDYFHKSIWFSYKCWNFHFRAVREAVFIGKCLEILTFVRRDFSIVECFPFTNPISICFSNLSKFSTLRCRQWFLSWCRIQMLDMCTRLVKLNLAELHSSCSLYEMAMIHFLGLAAVTIWALGLLGSLMFYERIFPL